MYFALLAPIVTFGGLLEEATHQRMAAMENLFGGSICGIIYHIFAGQPLTIIGSTGPVLVFETIVFEMCTRMGINFLSFRLWVSFYFSNTRKLEKKVKNEKPGVKPQLDSFIARIRP